MSDNVALRIWRAFLVTIIVTAVSVGPGQSGTKALELRGAQMGLLKIPSGGEVPQPSADRACFGGPALRNVPLAVSAPPAVPGVKGSSNRSSSQEEIARVFISHVASS